MFSIFLFIRFFLIRRDIGEVIVFGVGDVGVLFFFLGVFFVLFLDFLRERNRRKDFRMFFFNDFFFERCFLLFVF